MVHCSCHRQQNESLKGHSVSAILGFNKSTAKQRQSLMQKQWPPLANNAVPMLVLHGAPVHFLLNDILIKAAYAIHRGHIHSSAEQVHKTIHKLKEGSGTCANTWQKDRNMHVKISGKMQSDNKLWHCIDVLWYYETHEVQLERLTLTSIMPYEVSWLPEATSYKCQGPKCQHLWPPQFKIPTYSGEQQPRLLHWRPGSDVPRKSSWDIESSLKSLIGSWATLTTQEHACC